MSSLLRKLHLVVIFRKSSKVLRPGWESFPSYVYLIMMRTPLQPTLLFLYPLSPGKMPRAHSALRKNKGGKNERGEGQKEEGRKADDVRPFAENI